MGRRGGEEAGEAAKGEEEEGGISEGGRRAGRVRGHVGSRRKSRRGKTEDLESLTS